MSTDELTQTIIGASFKVHNTLGFGFREKIYQRAMVIELECRGLKVEEEHPLSVSYEGKIIGKHRADLLVAESVMVELKSILDLAKADEIQLVNYLKATGINVGLLINFGQSVQVKRKFKEYKPTHQR